MEVDESREEVMLLKAETFSELWLVLVLVLLAVSLSWSCKISASSQFATAFEKARSQGSLTRYAHPVTKR